jgi:hypothetical protein
MADVTIRIARGDDVDELVEMRRDFTFEDAESGEVAG